MCVRAQCCTCIQHSSSLPMLLFDVIGFSSLNFVHRPHYTLSHCIPMQTHACYQQIHTRSPSLVKLEWIYTTYMKQIAYAHFTLFSVEIFTNNKLFALLPKTQSTKWYQFIYLKSSIGHFISTRKKNCQSKICNHCIT